MTKHVLRLVLSAMLLALSVPAAAQQPQKIPRIGFLWLFGISRGS